MIRAVVRHRSISRPYTLCDQMRIGTVDTCTKSQHNIICDASVPLNATNNDDPKTILFCFFLLIQIFIFDFAYLSVCVFLKS